MVNRIPEKYIISAAVAEGKHLLNAFDLALLKIGIGDVNLIRVSSILPPGCREDIKLVFPPGALVPTVYGTALSDKPGALIAAAVGIGFSRDSIGIIMEHAGPVSAAEARRKVEEMIREAFSYRGMELVDIRIESVEHKVVKAGAAVAAVALW